MSRKTLNYVFVDILDIILGEEDDYDRGRTYHPALLLRSGDCLPIYEDDTGAIQFASFISKKVALERVNLVRRFLDMEPLISTNESI